MKKLIKLIFTTIICSLLFCGCGVENITKTNSKQNATAYYKGNSVEISDDEQLYMLLQQYSNIGEHRILNKLISQDSIQDFRKSGLVIDFQISGDNSLPVAGYSEPVKVKRIVVVDDDESLLVVFMEDSQLVLALTEKEMSELRNCINFK